MLTDHPTHPGWHHGHRLGHGPPLVEWQVVGFTLIVLGVVLLTA